MSIFADKKSWNMVQGLNHVFCRFISIPGNNMINVTALVVVTNNCVDNVLVSIIRCAWCRLANFGLCVSKFVCSYALCAVRSR